MSVKALKTLKKDIQQWEAEHGYDLEQRRDFNAKRLQMLHGGDGGAQVKDNTSTSPEDWQPLEWDGGAQVKDNTSPEVWQPLEWEAVLRSGPGGGILKKEKEITHIRATLNKVGAKGFAHKRAVTIDVKQKEMHVESKKPPNLMTKFALGGSIVPAESGFFKKRYTLTLTDNGKSIIFKFDTKPELDNWLAVFTTIENAPEAPEAAEAAAPAAEAAEAAAAAVAAAAAAAVAAAAAAAVVAAAAEAAVAAAAAAAAAAAEAAAAAVAAAAKVVGKAAQAAATKEAENYNLARYCIEWYKNLSAEDRDRTFNPDKKTEIDRNINDFNTDAGEQTAITYLLATLVPPAPELDRKKPTSCTRLFRANGVDTEEAAKKQEAYEDNRIENLISKKIRHDATKARDAIRIAALGGPWVRLCRQRLQDAQTKIDEWTAKRAGRLDMLYIIMRANLRCSQLELERSGAPRTATALLEDEVASKVDQVWVTLVDSLDTVTDTDTDSLFDNAWKALKGIYSSQSVLELRRSRSKESGKRDEGLYQLQLAIQTIQQLTAKGKEQFAKDQAEQKRKDEAREAQKLNQRKEKGREGVERENRIVIASRSSAKKVVAKILYVTPKKRPRIINGVTLYPGESDTGTYTDKITVQLQFDDEFQRKPSTKTLLSSCKEGDQFQVKYTYTGKELLTLPSGKLTFTINPDFRSFIFTDAGYNINRSEPLEVDTEVSSPFKEVQKAVGMEDDEPRFYRTLNTFLIVKQPYIHDTNNNMKETLEDCVVNVHRP
jgi:hypothetical protein